MQAELSPGDALVDGIAKAVYERLTIHVSLENRVFGEQLSFTEAEAAKIIGVPSTVLRDARLRGDFEPAKIGKSYRYSRDLIVAIIQARKTVLA